MSKRHAHRPPEPSELGLLAGCTRTELELVERLSTVTEVRPDVVLCSQGERDRHLMNDDAHVAFRRQRRGEAARLEFSILGPLEVTGPQGPIELRGAKRRGLLALLLVHAHQRLSVDRIVETLWADAGSPGATRTVQTYVSQLRRVLSDPGIEIAAHDGGYTLHVPVDAVDATSFEQLLRAAGDVASPSDRLRLLDEALLLWRGPPLEEFADAEWATPTRARLELLHLQAVEAHIDADLDLGRHREVIPTLEALVEEHALDERLWAQLLIAYYRSGRQADALRAYQRLRTTLADELGIEPTPELAALERQILDQDPALQAPAPAPVDARRDATSLPSGTVTFLFTDVAGSTGLWESNPDGMRRAYERHDSLVRISIEDGGGHVVKSTGDGVMAVFADAAADVASAVDLQQKLTTEDWLVPIHVRCGLHTGTATVAKDDYYGPAVNRAAKVAAAAHPGQVLITAPTAALAEGWEFRDLGEYELRGLEPLRLFQVMAPGLRQDFPRPTQATRVADLPAPPTSFIGRASDIDRVATLLDAHPLVTLTGAGGCGKTRLSIEAAHRLADQFQDGAVFVDLAAATDDERAIDAIADALGLIGSAGSDDTLDRIVAYLAEREILFILDNCEHILDASAQIALAVIAGEHRCCLLATSREPLGVVGEQVYVVPSLDTVTESSRGW